VRTPYCIGVWKTTLGEATAWVTEHRLGEEVIQFYPDPVRGVWVILRVNHEQHLAITTSPGTSKVI